MNGIRIFLVFAVVLMLSVPIDATDTELYTADEFDVGSVIEALPEDVRNSLPSGDIFSSDGISERFSFEYFYGLIKKNAISALKPALGTLSATLGLVIIASVLTAIKGTVRSDSLVSLFDFASGLCIMLTLYSTASSLTEAVSVYLIQLQNVVGAMVPVTVAIGTAGGSITSSAASGSAMMLGLSLVETLASQWLYPILKLCFGLAIASGIGGGFSLGGISKTVRGLFLWVLGLTSAVISAVMTFQTSITVRADSLSMRAVKFAASKSVPVVGGIASDAVSAVAGSLTLVKTTVGWVGIVIIAVLTLPVIMQVLLTRLGVIIAQTAADVLGLERERRLLEETSGLFGFLAAICVIAALMFVYALAVFAKSAAAIT